MKRVSTSINLTYVYDANRKYHKYTFDGEHYRNRGQFLATCFIHGVTGDFQDVDSVAYDKGTDFDEWNCSFKSAKATLVHSLASSFAETLDVFFEHSVADKYGWLVQDEEQIHCYLMNIDEFKAFIGRFGKWDESTNTIRFPENSKHLYRWFDRRI